MLVGSIDECSAANEREEPSPESEQQLDTVWPFRLPAEPPNWKGEVLGELSDEEKRRRNGGGPSVNTKEAETEQEKDLAAKLADLEDGSGAAEEEEEGKKKSTFERKCSLNTKLLTFKINEIELAIDLPIKSMHSRVQHQFQHTRQPLWCIPIARQQCHLQILPEFSLKMVMNVWVL